MKLQLVAFVHGVEGWAVSISGDGNGMCCNCEKLAGAVLVLRLYSGVRSPVLGRYKGFYPCFGCGQTAVT